MGKEASRVMEGGLEFVKLLCKIGSEAKRRNFVILGETAQLVFKPIEFGI